MANYDVDREEYNARRSEWQDDSRSLGTADVEARGHLTAVDTVILAGLVIGGYFAAYGLAGASTPTSETGAGSNVPVPHVQVCSDEELRQMRSGPDTCYVAPSLDRHDRYIEPRLKVQSNS